MSLGEQDYNSGVASLSAYWVTFNGATKPGCIEAVSEAEARAQAEKIGELATLNTLPYPANPRLSESKGECPSFCYTPSQCQGRTSCPKVPACDD
jgi:hypothetical protein